MSAWDEYDQRNLQAAIFNGRLSVMSQELQDRALACVRLCAGHADLANVAVVHKPTLEKLAAADAELGAMREQLAQANKRLSEECMAAFKGNIDACNKLDLDAMDAQSILLAVQNWDISTGRARELLRCWVLGTYDPKMLPECGPELFPDSQEPREEWARMQKGEPTEAMIEAGGTELFGHSREKAIEFAKEEKFDSCCIRAREVFEAMMKARSP